MRARKNVCPSQSKLAFRILETSFSLSLHFKSTLFFDIGFFFLWIIYFLTVGTYVIY